MSKFISEKASFTIRTWDLIKNGIIPADFVGNSFINDYDNNYFAMKNKQNFFEIYALDMQELLGDMYDKYDYFNIILRQVNTGGKMLLMI